MRFAWRSELAYSLRHPRVRLALVGLAGSMALLLMVVLAYWWPAWHTTQSLTRELDHYRRVAHDKRYSSELAVVVKRAREQVGEVEKRLDQPAVQTQLVQNLDQLARRHKLRILSSNYDDGREQDGFRPTSHELAVQGTYGNLRQFLAEIARMSTLTVLEDAAVTRQREGGGLKANLVFRTWRRGAGSGDKS